MRRTGAMVVVLAACAAMLTVASIATGVAAASASVSPGIASSWGANDLNALGAPSVPGALVLSPLQVGNSAGWNSVSAADSAVYLSEASFAIRSDGSLWAWGDNTAGQLGLGHTSGTGPKPLQVGTDTDWKTVVTSSDDATNPHTFAIKTDGSLWAWGRDGGSVLGDGGTTTRMAPTRIGTDNHWRAVATSDEHTVALKTDGTLWAWGANTVGQLGNGTMNPATTPEQIGSASDWASIAVGPFYSLATKSDGSLWAWGANNDGRLGDGTNTTHTTPTRVGSATNWSSVVATDEQQRPPSSYALRTDGTLWAWGGNNAGQLGDGTTMTRTTPVQIGTDTWSQIAHSPSHTLGLKTDGSLWAWGGNGVGELGDGTKTTRLAPEAVAVGTTWSKVAAGAMHSLAVRADGTLWAWGYNWVYDLPPHVPQLLPQWRTEPGPVDTTNRWVSVNAENGDVIAIRDDGTLWGWGYNTDGELGDGTIATKPRPVQVGTSSDWRYIAGTAASSFGIKADGTLWSWGTNSDSQLGRMGDRTVPAQVGTDTWKTVAGGWLHTVAIRSDGTLWAWGDDSAGEIGDGNVGGGWVFPREVSTATNWASVAAAEKFTLAIKTDGTLWSWGDNTTGQLGLGTTGGVRSTPQQVGSDTHWRSVQARNDHVIALKADGTLWGWGANNAGELGDGTTGTVVNAPKQIGTDADWSAFAAGFTHTLARKTSGALWGWGDNTVGQLGDATTTDHPTPARIGTATDWISISAGGKFSIGLTPATPTAPGVPTGVNATAGSGSAAVKWTAPISDGGSPIAAYVITPFEQGVALPPRRYNSTATAQTVTGLQKGKSYTFVVAAANGVGTGSYSSPSNAVSPK